LKNNMFKRIIDFILCLLFKEDCQYSVKKILAIIFIGVAIYLIIWTDKSAIEALGFAAVLLGLRTYERGKEMTLGRKFGTPPPPIRSTKNKPS